MASYTGNLNLKKPALDDDALITDINNNMDILDAAVNGIQDGLAIVANGNTHVAITSGQFVYVRNHGTLMEGLYVASTNIAANATLSTSNLTADAAGGLNSLNSKIEKFTASVSTSGTKLYKDALFKRVGSLFACATINGLNGLTNVATNTVLTIPSGFVPDSSKEVVVVSAVYGERYKLNFSSNGNLEVYPYTGVSDQHNVIIAFTYSLF